MDKTLHEKWKCALVQVFIIYCENKQATCETY